MSDQAHRQHALRVGAARVDPPCGAAHRRARFRSSGDLSVAHPDHLSSARSGATRVLDDVACYIRRYVVLSDQVS